MVEAFILVRIQPHRLDESSSLMQNVKQDISKLEGVKEIKGVFGHYDFVVLVETKTVPELGNLVTERIRRVKEVADTETLIVGF